MHRTERRGWIGQGLEGAVCMGKNDISSRLTDPYALGSHSAYTCGMLVVVD